MQKTNPDLPLIGNGQLIAYDMTNIHSNCLLSFNLGEVDISISSGNPFSEPTNLPAALYKLEMNECCNFDCGAFTDFNVTITDQESTSLYFWQDPSTAKLMARQAEFRNEIDKSSGGRPNVKILWAGIDQLDGYKPENNTVILKRMHAKKPEKPKNQEKIEIKNDLFGDSEPTEMGKPTDYRIFLNDVELGNATFKQGGNYNVLVSGVVGTEKITVHQVTPENTFSMFWQLPQYLIMTCGELLFSITSMEFCFTQVCFMTIPAMAIFF